MKGKFMRILKASFNLSVTLLKAVFLFIITFTKAIFLIIVTLILFCLFAKIFAYFHIGS